MSNVLKVNKQTTISELHAKGWSLRRIAHELGLNRRTVAAYANRKPKPICDFSPNCTTEVIAGPPSQKRASKTREARAKASLASGKSLCRDHEAFITSRLEAGLTAERILIFPRKRVEGLLLLFGFMVLGGFEVERGFIAEGRVQPGSIIEAFDVVENHEFGLLSGFWKR